MRSSAFVGSHNNMKMNAMLYIKILREKWKTGANVTTHERCEMLLVFRRLNCDK